MPAVEGEIVVGVVTWVGRHIITKVEAFDQNSEFTGGHVYSFTGGVNQPEVTVHLQSSAQGYGIDFIVNVYGEPQPPHDFILGELTPRSVLVHT